MTVKTHLRIHPAIGIARVGNSQDYYLGPETMAGMPQAGTNLTGGLPIKKNTESTAISSEELRENGKLKKQAARFKIFQYQAEDSLSYPSGRGTEVTLGSMVDGKKVTDIIWTVHLANKKANCWVDGGLDAFERNNRPAIRNINFPNSQDPADKNRLQKLIIDAGPRTISTKARTQIAFDQATDACYWDTQNITPLPNYPKSFPASASDETKYDCASQSIDYLGEMTTEENGRLIVLGGFGKACGFDNQGQAKLDAGLPHDVNNDNWLDDTSDGPVTAVLIFEDGSNLPIEGSAWVVATDPGYAPQVLNTVSVWDDVLATWVEKFGLCPDVFDIKDNKYQDDYEPDFNDHVLPVLRAAALQRWTTNLPSQAINAHEKMAQLTKSPPPFDFLAFIRKPYDPNNPNDSGDPKAQSGSPHMPLSLGDIGKSFLTISTTQYFFLEQWVKGKCENANKQELGAGELLDKTILFNCLGGRFSPGIDLTYIVRDTHLYNKDWTNPAIGPFRINMEKLDYSKANKETPFLGVGYIPLHNDPIQPGDICKFMAIPWHTDYNSCAVHSPFPNPGGEITKDNIYSGVNTSLFWSWPAQRPVAVYTYEDVVSNSGTLPATQHYSV
ncbi:MAG TPA: LodA/GoxA family CTQ-dependent oxidase, partial [Methylococcales bacterium]